jgi:hypothetical protein
MSEAIRDRKFVELTYKVADRKSGHVLTGVEFPWRMAIRRPGFVAWACNPDFTKKGDL